MSFSDLAVAYGEYCSVLNDAVTQAEDDIWAKCKKKNPSYEKCQNTIFWGFGKFRVSQKLLSYVVSYSVIGNGWVASIYVMTFRLTLR